MKEWINEQLIVALLKTYRPKTLKSWIPEFKKIRFNCIISFLRLLSVIISCQWSQTWLCVRITREVLKYADNWAHRWRLPFNLRLAMQYRHWDLKTNKEKNNNKTQKSSHVTQMQNLRIPIVIEFIRTLDAEKGFTFRCLVLVIPSF